jgi:hypothetical protein
MELKKDDAVKAWIALPGETEGHWEYGWVENAEPGFVKVITKGGGMLSGPPSMFERTEKENEHASSISSATSGGSDR